MNHRQKRIGNLLGVAHINKHHHTRTRVRMLEIINHGATDIVKRHLHRHIHGLVDLFANQAVGNAGNAAGGRITVGDYQRFHFSAAGRINRIADDSGNRQAVKRIDEQIVFIIDDIQ